MEKENASEQLTRFISEKILSQLGGSRGKEFIDKYQLMRQRK